MQSHPYLNYVQRIATLLHISPILVRESLPKGSSHRVVVRLMLVNLRRRRMANLRKIGEEVGCLYDTTRYYLHSIFVQELSLLVLEGNVSVLGYYLLWDIIEFWQVPRTRARNVMIVIANAPAQGCGILLERGETAH